MTGNKISKTTRQTPPGSPSRASSKQRKKPVQTSSKRKKATSPRRRATEIMQPESGLFYQNHPFLKWVEFYIWQFLLTVSKSTKIQAVNGKVKIYRETLKKLLTPPRIKKLKRYLSEKILSLPIDDRIIAWDFLKNGQLPSEIRLDYTNLPEDFFKVPVPAKLRETVRAFLTMGYSPAAIVPVIGEAFPGLDIMEKDVQKYRIFYWNIGDLMDSAEGQIAFLNAFTRIKSEIGSCDQDIPPMVSYNLIFRILSGQIDATDLALHIGIVPPQYRDIATHLRNQLPIIAIKLTKLIQSNDDEKTAHYLANVALKYAEFLQKLGISVGDSPDINLMDRININHLNPYKNNMKEAKYEIAKS